MEEYEGTHITTGNTWEHVETWRKINEAKEKKKNNKE